MLFFTFISIFCKFFFTETDKYVSVLYKLFFTFFNVKIILFILLLCPKCLITIILVII